MIEHLPQAMASLNAASTMISSLIGLRDFAKYATQLNELHGHIIKANTTIISEQQSHFALSAKIQELEKECMRLKDWSAEKERYSRQQIADGVFAYVENEPVAPLQEKHKLCCDCFDKNIKSTLQQKQIIDRGWHLQLTCSNGCQPLVFRDYKDVH
ncbi:hypothetical protein [Geotalea uraniireducens]|uniref:Uncharacterized protein n=1 Tax=Geotalea uraniireducens (strain Rf4) TaxID=351605 RepID=A5G3S8_GEOUR|nr:hypothetical protein [Geotalea uraniireducens]ABQ26446.1 hypothetical protein Gura_2264 [Geotalea uraniireducens Rf4]